MKESNQNTGPNGITPHGVEQDLESGQVLSINLSKNLEGNFEETLQENWQREIQMREKALSLLNGQPNDLDQISQPGPSDLLQ